MALEPAQSLPLSHDRGSQRSISALFRPLVPYILTARHPSSRGSGACAAPPRSRSSSRFYTTSLLPKAEEALAESQVDQAPHKKRALLTNSCKIPPSARVLCMSKLLVNHGLPREQGSSRKLALRINSTSQHTNLHPLMYRIRESASARPETKTQKGGPNTNPPAYRSKAHKKERHCAFVLRNRTVN